MSDRPKQTFLAEIAREELQKKGQLFVFWTGIFWSEPGLGFKREIWNRQALWRFQQGVPGLQFAGDFNALKSLVPSGTPQPVQASQPVPAAN